MNEDRLYGTAKNVAGKAEEGLGRVIGDTKTELSGKARQVEGQLQDMYGQAADTAAQAARAVRETASDAEDFIRHTIEQRPYTTAAVALGIGFLLGRLARRDY